MNIDRARDLEAKIAELRERLPKHSVPPAMLEELEELEIELEEIRAAADEEGQSGEAGAE